MTSGTEPSVEKLTGVNRKLVNGNNYKLNKIKGKFNDGSLSSQTVDDDFARECGFGGETPKASLMSQISVRLKDLFIQDRSVSPIHHRLKRSVIDYLNNKSVTNDSTTNRIHVEEPGRLMQHVVPSVIINKIAQPARHVAGRRRGAASSHSVTTHPSLIEILRILKKVNREDADVATLRTLLRKYPVQQPVSTAELIRKRLALEKQITDANYAIPRLDERNTNGILTFRRIKQTGGVVVSDPPWHLAQIVAAYDLFARFYIDGDHWAHLDAPTQGGKTGVLSCLTEICQINENRRTDGYDTPYFVPNLMGRFVVTAMSDASALKQTKGRFKATQVADNHIAHLPNIKKNSEFLQLVLTEVNTQEPILILDDESHIGTRNGQQKDKNLYEPIRSAQNPHVRVVTVSATDCVKGSSEEASQVELAIVEGYTSLMDKLRSGKVFCAEAFELLNTENGVRLLFTFADRNRRDFCENAPTYDIIRPPPKSYDMVMHMAKEKYGSENVIEINCESELRDSVLKLAKAPSAPTCVLLKNMLSVSNTVSDQHINLWYERDTSSSTTFIQRLRPLGYNKQSRVVLIVPSALIENYLERWSQGAAGVAGSLAIGASRKEVLRTTGGTLALQNGGILTTHQKQRGPMAGGIAPQLASSITDISRHIADEAKETRRAGWDYFGLKTVCRTEQEVIKQFEDRYPHCTQFRPGKIKRKPHEEGPYKGFITEYRSGTTGIERVLSHEEFLADLFGKGVNVCGKIGGRWRIYYMDISDPTTIRYAYVVPKPAGAGAPAAPATPAAPAAPAADRGM